MASKFLTHILILSGTRSRRFLSPPPPASISVPPVPRLPPSFTSRGRDVIIPNANAFLRDLDSRLSGPATAQPSAPGTSAAPRSHHLPFMGFGGALLARVSDETRTRRQQERTAREARVRQRDERMNRGLGIHQSAQVWGMSGDLFGGDLFEDGAHEEGMFTHFGFMADAFHAWNTSSDWSRLWDRLPRVLQRPAYQVVYTHEDERPTPGFTYDFDPSEKEREAICRRKVAAGVLVLDESGEIEIEEAALSSAASSSFGVDEATSSLLICARCSDPLLLGGVGASKLWALRCGHMVDGKCVEALMRPPAPTLSEPAPEPASNDNVADRQPARAIGKGKVRGKGKGRGSAIGDVEPTVTAEEERVSARSSVTAHSITRAGSKRSSILKGKTRASNAALLAEHTWECPVVGCRQAHVSEQLKGGEGHEGEVRWVHRHGQGAVQVFA
jgi:hypothetical protein